MEDKTVIKAVAIVCLTILESVALVINVDGVLFLPVAAMIGGIAGYGLKDIKISKHDKIGDNNGRYK